MGFLVFSFTAANWLASDMDGAGCWDALLVDFGLADLFCANGGTPNVGAGGTNVKAGGGGGGVGIEDGAGSGAGGIGGAGGAVKRDISFAVGMRGKGGAVGMRGAGGTAGSGESFSFAGLTETIEDAEIRFGGRRGALVGVETREGRIGTVGGPRGVNCGSSGFAWGAGFQAGFPQGFFGGNTGVSL